VFGVVSADRTRFTWANAGHPPAALVCPDTVTMLSRPRGLLLGVRADYSYPQAEVRLRDGDLVVLYTDGLVERRGENLQEGFDRLVAVSARAAVRGPSADAVAEQLLETLLARQARADDVCVLTGWSMADAQPSLELDLAPEPSSSRAARGQVTATLHQWGADELADPVELLVSELVTNAVSHVGGGVHLRMEKLPVGVRVRVFDGGDEPLPEVDDEVPPDAPTGRGLLIVDNVADRWGVERTETGKQVWFELSYEGAVRRWARRASTSGVDPASRVRRT
jgi:anti-sigma regulatory factor (Ser/Thr protein kinase)